MKIRIKSFNGVLPEYLTVGKVYGVLKKITINGQVFFNIITDNGNMASVCRHDLNGGSWEIVGDNTTDNVADIKYHVSPNIRVSDERA